MTPGEETARAFVGRPEVLESLRRHLDRLQAGEGGFSLLLGDVGVGKSTLVQTLAREARARGVEVLVGKVPALENPPPLHLIRQAIQSVVAEDELPAGPVCDRIRWPSLSRPMAPSRLFSGSTATPGRTRPRRWTNAFSRKWWVPPADEAGHSWMFAQLADRILSRAEVQPTILLLEDLHTADISSLEFLEYLAPQISGHRLWLVGTSLPRDSLSELLKITFERVARGTKADEIVLRPLTASELGEFVRLYDGRVELNPEEITRWHSQTGGNPLFIEQILRTRRERVGGGNLLDTPARELGEYLTRQLADLADEEQRALSVAAVLGKEFPFPLWLRASGEEEERLAEISEQLIARGLLREQPDERFEFAREDLRGQIYSSMTESRRRVLHRHAAEALEATGFAEADHDLCPRPALLLGTGRRQGRRLQSGGR